jgi:RNA polymerase sigma-70 factor (ECF subfamily)
MPDDAETAGLLALMLIHDARREARVGADGRYVALPDQDRARWDAAALAEGRAAARPRAAPAPPGPYQLQAAIASLHCEQEVDWPQIAALYRLLACMAPSPVVEVNRAVALGMAGSPDAGLALLDARRARPLPALPRGARRAAAPPRRRRGADGAYARAIELSANAVERAELERRRGTRTDESGPRP